MNVEANGGQLANILLVEDDPGDTRLIRRIFEQGRLMLNLACVEDGEEALAYLRREGRFAHARRPDLILLDLNLPRKNGREVLSEIKSDPELKNIPVLVMTTSTAEQDISRAYSLNANCYIAKPLELEDFIAVVQSIEDFWLTKASLPAKA